MNKINIRRFLSTQTSVLLFLPLFKLAHTTLHYSGRNCTTVDFEYAHYTLYLSLQWTTEIVIENLIFTIEYQLSTFSCNLPVIICINVESLHFSFHSLLFKSSEKHIRHILQFFIDKGKNASQAAKKALLEQHQSTKIYSGSPEAPKTWLKDSYASILQLDLA